MITVALMVVIREQVRWYWLIDHVESLTVAADPQWGLLRPLLVWAVIIMGMGMVGWKRWKKAVQGK
jgi:hypothetical protein